MSKTRSEPEALVTMRIADMTRMHPRQDDSHVCAECAFPVGIYPSGQEALRKHPTMRVICSHCVERLGDFDNVSTGDFETIMQEGRDSYDVGRG